MKVGMKQEFDFQTSLTGLTYQIDTYFLTFWHLIYFTWFTNLFNLFTSKGLYYFFFFSNIQNIFCTTGSPDFET